VEIEERQGSFTGSAREWITLNDSALFEIGVEIDPGNLFAGQMACLRGGDPQPLQIMRECLLRGRENLREIYPAPRKLLQFPMELDDVWVWFEDPFLAERFRAPYEDTWFPCETGRECFQVDVAYYSGDDIIYQEVWQPGFGRSLLDVSVDSLEVYDDTGTFIGYYQYQVLIQAAGDWFHSISNPADWNFYPLVPGDKRLYRKLTISLGDTLEDLVMRWTGIPQTMPNELSYYPSYFTSTQEPWLQTDFQRIDPFTGMVFQSLGEPDNTCANGDVLHMAQQAATDTIHWWNCIGTFGEQISYDSPDGEVWGVYKQGEWGQTDSLLLREREGLVQQRSELWGISTELELIGSELDGQLSGTWRNLDFYPLNIGDRWQYEREYLLHGADSTEFTDYPMHTIVGDTVLPNDQHYYIKTIEHSLGTDTVFMRMDSLDQKVWIHDPDSACPNREQDPFWFPGDSTEDYSWEGCGPVDRTALVHTEDSLSFSYVGVVADSYTFTRGLGISSRYYYQEGWPVLYETWTLLAAEINGEEWGSWVGINDDQRLCVEGFALGSAYPNPFNGNVIIPFQVPEDTRDASIRIYNLNGQLVREYDLSDYPNHSLRWDALDAQGIAVPSGVYLIQIQSDYRPVTIVQKLVYLK